MIRILFIEGNDQDALRVQEYYNSDPEGRFICVRVPTLREGLDQIQNQKGFWDMTLMDLALPDSDGIGSFDQALEKNPETPVVVISSEADEEQGDRHGKARGSRLSLENSLGRSLVDQDNAARHRAQENAESPGHSGETNPGESKVRKPFTSCGRYCS